MIMLQLSLVNYFCLSTLLIALLCNLSHCRQEIAINHILLQQVPIRASSAGTMKLIDLPPEVLRNIAFLFAPPEPSEVEARGGWTPGCTEMTDLRSLRAVCRRLKQVTDAAVSTCLYRHGPLRLDLDQFSLALRRLPAPNNVRHLHLSTVPACVENSILYVKNFPALHKVEVLDVDASLWPQLVLVLALVPGLRTVIVHCRFGWDAEDGVMNGPTETDARLTQVKSLAVFDISEVLYLDRFLQWTPKLQRLRLQFVSWCTGENADGFDKALNHCADTLQYLDVGEWRMYQAWPGDDRGAAVDLTKMKALEEVTAGSLSTYPERPHDWKFPPSVKRIRDPIFNMDIGGYVNIDALFQLAFHHEVIAPGLQQLTVRVWPGLSDTQQEMLGAVERCFKAAGIDLVFEHVPEED